MSAGRQTAIVILGLPRSGSTFIQARLCSHENVVGLGEVFQTTKAIMGLKSRSAFNILRRQSNWDASRVRNIKDKVRADEFWSVAERDLEKKRYNSFEAVRRVYEIASDMYPDKILIDSSKHQSHYDKLRALDSVQVRPFVIVRHPIAWLSSIQKYNRKYRLKRSGAMLELARWYRTNNKLLNLARKESEDVVVYDDFVLNNRCIQDFFYDLDLGNPSRPNLHEMVGSDTYFSADDVAKYDHEWIVDTKLPKLSLALWTPFVYSTLERCHINQDRK